MNAEGSVYMYNMRHDHGGTMSETSRRSTWPSSHPTASKKQVGLRARLQGVISGGNQKSVLLLSADVGTSPDSAWRVKENNSLKCLQGSKSRKNHKSHMPKKCPLLLSPSRSISFSAVAGKHYGLDGAVMAPKYRNVGTRFAIPEPSCFVIRPRGES